MLSPGRDLDDARSTAQHLERQAFDAVSSIEEMPWRIDVGASVGTHVNRRHVGTVAHWQSV